MRQFYLIDPWLADAKGHNYQYALDVGGAAQQRGWEPILATRKQLASDLRFPQAWTVENVFPFGECPRHWISLDARSRQPYDIDGAWLSHAGVRWWRRLLDLPARWDRRRRIQSFLTGCQRLFAAVPPRPGDILFMPSLSEFDFVSAVRFWRDHPWTRNYDWHLQFHFNFFTGRDPEFAQQDDMLRRFQQLFRAAVDQVPEHRLHFYATTEALARQYDALGIAIFHPLPYPVRTLKRADPELDFPRSPRPLRVTLPGAMRREKGKKRLGRLLETVHGGLLRPKRVQFVFQASDKAIRRWLPRTLHGQVSVGTDTMRDVDSSLLATDHPLDAQRYTELICRSDIGLFAYDAGRYFPRASGVLCEMLSAGVPVIVPAGCWLADQIADENYRNVERLWRRHAEDGQLRKADMKSEAMIDLPESSRVQLVRFAWPRHARPGTYIELHFQSDDSSAEFREIVSSPREGLVGLVLRWERPVQFLKVAMRNAYDSSPLEFDPIQFLSLPSAGDDCGLPPLGSVGLIAASDREIPRLLLDICDHYGDYAAACQEFAKEWQIAHSPLLTVNQLESRSSTSLTGWTLHAA